MAGAETAALAWEAGGFGSLMEERVPKLAGLFNPPDKRPRRRPRPRKTIGLGRPLRENAARDQFLIVLIAFNKPFGVLSQFTPDGSPNRPLAEFGLPPRVYPIGRLDADSEGLLLLSDEPAWNERLLHPRQAHAREYWAQVERVPAPEALQRLARGAVIAGRPTLPCRAWLLEPQPQMPPRDPPIRFRKTVPDCWIGLELVEGKNRQVRRMTAAIGHPTLRLVRVRIGQLRLAELTLPPSAWKVLSEAESRRVLETQA